MTYTYKHLKDSVTGETATDVILRKEDNACIPFDEANKDYQDYLKFCNGQEPYTEKGITEAAD